MCNNLDPHRFKDLKHELNGEMDNLKGMIVTPIFYESWIII